MEHFGERVFVKTGAEGVFCGALPELGIGIALKCDDGGGRASGIMMAGVIARLLPLSDADNTALAPFLHPTLRNWAGTEVGALRPSSMLLPEG